MRTLSNYLAEACRDVLFRLHLRRGYVIKSESLHMADRIAFVRRHDNSSPIIEPLTFLLDHNMVWRWGDLIRFSVDPPNRYTTLHFSRKKDAAMFLLRFGGSLVQRTR